LAGDIEAEIIGALDAAGIEVHNEDDGIATVVALGDTEGEPSVIDHLATGSGRLLVIVSPATGSSSDAVWALLARGASEVVQWRGSASAADVKARLERWSAVDALVETSEVRARLVGASPMWRSALRHVVEVARFSDANVLITGESGTGKELVARTIHDLDDRNDKGAFVVVDCSSVVRSLSGSEFFGHERGAFTGAIAEREGAFALADGGTLFLDEVGELPMELQAELLRVVQEGTYKRVGSNAWRSTTFRLVCATNRDLRREEAEGRFRRDFYFRIAASTLHLPPLMARRDDVLPLFQWFLRSIMNRDVDVEPVVSELLLSRAYPGNVRDLRQLAVRVANRHVGPGPITAGDVPEDERPERGPPPVSWTSALATGCERALGMGLGLRDIQEAASEAAIQAALATTRGHVASAAKLLGITDRALHLRRAHARDRAAATGRAARPKGASTDGGRPSRPDAPGR
jgi:transcriptional regulator with GAF, ATPase, and Fis domain